MHLQSHSIYTWPSTFLFIGMDNLNTLITPLSGSSDDDLLRFCWGFQDCWSCLKASSSCSWCPFSSACVPNPSTIPIFSPVLNNSICPLGPKEQWELRSRPLGCAVSTITVLTAITSILGTSIVGLLVWTVVTRVINKLKRKQRGLEDQDGGISGSFSGIGILDLLSEGWGSSMGFGAYIDGARGQRAFFEAENGESMSGYEGERDPLLG
ncbi:conserved hypothetical protein [Coccidioides posadasii str. Silveira]|uniref:PSI domain-containing protein n=1 Tax=Coccidioides posadasii (strain RMSCC 757 / Silveira) TaxID=443226 RepID=E9CUL4_COCPS|nr:conserved hypothetical protein [Coccidioides posadasii str. Silveira]